jgi:hypothetical protein
MHPFCNLQSRELTHIVLVIGLYELYKNIKFKVWKKKYERIWFSRNFDSALQMWKTICTDTGRIYNTCTHHKWRNENKKAMQCCSYLSCTCSIWAGKLHRLDLFIYILSLTKIIAFSGTPITYYLLSFEILIVNPGLPIFTKTEILYRETGWELLSVRRKRRRLQL